MKTGIELYKYLKEKACDAIILFCGGNWYTAYEEDAVKCGKILGITITRKDGYKQCNFPGHGLDTYLPKLIRNGCRVAIITD